MLTNLTLENFKAFQKLNNLKIKPITILCGTNSCGKSSILQSILLMKQTLESRNSKQNLLLNGQYVKLGAFEDVIYKKDIDKEVSFEFSFDIIPNFNEEYSISLFDLLGKAFVSGSKYKVNYKISFNIQSENKVNKNDYLTSLNIPHFGIIILSENNKRIGFSILFTNIEKNLYKIEWVNLNSAFRYNDNRTTERNLQFENLLPVFKNNDFRQGDLPLDTFIIKNNIQKINNLLQNLFSHYSYIGPLRYSHKDGGGFYYGDDTNEIGNSGENAPFLFLKEKNKKIEAVFYNKKEDNFLKKKMTTLEEALEEWFVTMGLTGFKGTVNNRHINLHLNASKFDATPIDISQVGFGVSQMFPILLEGLRMSEGNTLLLEQPEIHLHPNLQMQMADFFISLALAGKRVMAETHSDHIVNRLVRRIVEDEEHNLKDLIGIYFIKPSENGAVYEEIEIDEMRGVTNWPKDFFDQTANEQMRIMQAGLKKRRKQRTLIKQ